MSIITERIASYKLSIIIPCFNEGQHLAQFINQLKITIQDTQAESNQCKAYIQNDKLTIFCRKAVSYGSEYCPFHRNKRMLVIEGTNPIQIQRLKDTNSIGPMWVNNNTLYNSNGEMVGKMKDDKIKIFVYE